VVQRVGPRGLLLAGLGMLTAVWLATVPPVGPPDEDVHLAYAVAVGHGDRGEPAGPAAPGAPRQLAFQVAVTRLYLQAARETVRARGSA